MYRQALTHLLARTQGRQSDHLGFNASDRNAARTLVKRPVWSPQDQDRARELCYKYRDQLVSAGYHIEEGHVRGAHASYQCAILRETSQRIEVLIFASRKTLWLDRDRIALRRTGTIYLGTRAHTKAIVTLPQGLAARELRLAKAA